MLLSLQTDQTYSINTLYGKRHVLDKIKGKRILEMLVVYHLRIVHEPVNLSNTLKVITYNNNS
jgi:hypothetical protein